MIEKMKNLNQFDTKKNMSKSFTIKKYWFVTLCLLFCSLTAVAQEYNDQTINFNVNEVTSTLKKLGVKEQDMTRDISIMRKMHMRRYLAMQKIKAKLSIEKTTVQSSKTSFNRSLSAAVTTTDVPQSEKDVLKLIYDISSTKSALWGWNFSIPVTTWNDQTKAGWYGVTVTDGHITELDIDFVFELNGAIPTQIKQLSYLQNLSITSQRTIQSTIPHEIGMLTKLKKLRIAENNITGTIPNEIGLLTQLTDLRISDNKLNGTIPNEITNLTNLQTLELKNNDLSGLIPAGTFQLPNLKHLRIWDKLFTGTIPASVGSLLNLEEISLYANGLTGTIPTEIKNLTNLKRLDLMNTQLTGLIPSEIGNLSNLEALSIENSLISGPIPPSIGQLAKLDILNIYNVPLTGTIPPEIGNLSKLTNLYISNTQISGSIPQRILQLPNLVTIQITGNTKLNGILPPLQLPNIEMANFELNNLTGNVTILSCPFLSELYLYNNQFTSISPNIGQTNLYLLNLSNNKITGTSELLSNLIQQLPNLQELYVANNQFSGALPVNIGNITSLDLSYNKFAGSIPLFSNISNLNYLELSNNQLSGPISSQILNSLLSNLGSLDISSNKYTFLDLINTIRENPTFESKVTYWPQGKIGQPKTIDTTVDYVVQLSMDYNSSPDDTFQWYKGISPNGVLYQSPGTNPNNDRLVLEDVGYSDSGYYYFKTTSRFFGDNFVMESEPIKLNVLCSPQTNGSLNITSSDLVVGQPINFSFESATPNLTYRWTFYNLAGEITGTSTLSIPSASQRYTQPGDYKIKLEVTQQSCITTFEKTFTVLSCTPITGIIKIIKDTGYPFQFSNSGITSVLACNETAFPNKFYANTQTLNIGTKLYTNQSLSTPVPVTNSSVWYKTQDNTTAYKIDTTSKITEVYTCSTSTCNKRFLDYVTVVAQEPITLNYFLPNGTEVNKTFEPVPRGGDQPYTFSIGACINETSLTIDGPVLSQTVAWNDNQNCCQATSRAYRFSSPGRDSASLVCPETSFPDTFYAASTSLGIGTQLYLDPELKNKVGSENTWRKEGIDGQTIRIANDGTVAEFSNCGAEEPTTNTYGYQAMHPYEHTGTDYVIYIDANGVQRQIDLPRAQEGENIDTAPCIEIVARRIVSHSGVTACTP